MLIKFKVKNFKNFKEELEFDFTKINESYKFNESLVKFGVVGKSLVYGKNASGKSNLGLAIFDIVKNITDKEPQPRLYNNYLNAASSEETAKFLYTFKFGKSVVEYYYEKSNYEIIVNEELKINEKVVIKYDRRQKEEPIFNLPETVNLNKKIVGLSVVKYVKNNTIISANSTLGKFFKFVENMLFFKSVEGNIYIGHEIGTASIDTYIIENKLIKSAEEFLNKAEINCKLCEVISEGEKTVGFNFEDKKIPFYNIASSGTKDLLLLFYWLQKLKNVSFLYIDEFDAHYHFKLSKLVVEEILKNENLQAVMTTHTSPIMSNRLLRPDCYFKLENNKIKSLDELSDTALEKIDDIEKIYRAGGFDE